MSIDIFEAPGRLIAEDDYGDFLIRVVTGFQIENCNCPYQVSIGRTRDAMVNVGGLRHAGIEKEAIDDGFAIGRAAIDDMQPSPSR